MGAAVLAAAAVITLLCGGDVGFASRLTDTGAATPVCGPTVTFGPDQLGPVQPIGPRSPVAALRGIVTVRYRWSPPSEGRYLAYGSPGAAHRFYGPAGASPSLPALVDALLHGYTVVFYRPGRVDGAQVGQLREIADRAAGRKLLVVPWRAGAYSQPSTAAESHRQDPVALVAWRHVQTCSNVSGLAVAEFMERFPPMLAPEPAGR